MTADLPEEELTSVLEDCVSEILWEAEVDQPPVDAFLVARRLGIRVVEDAALSTRGRLARLHEANRSQATDVILLARESRPERRHWAVAHEIGEHAAHRIFDRLALDPRDTVPAARESVANALASRLLMPAAWFLADAAASVWELPDLKAIYATASHELIARRVLELIPRPAIVSVLDHGEIAWRRTNFDRRWLAMTERERGVWQGCHESGRASLAEPADGPLARLRCWPVHEPGWRREIMLSELSEFAE